jgi:hypothetical protein
MTPHDLETESYVFWRSHGCDHLHASAWCGNEAGETSFRTDRPVGDRDTGGAYGPAQHHKYRIDIIKAKTGIDIRTAPHIDQLRGILWEVTSSKEYGHVYGDFLRADTMEEAITVLVRDFEKVGKYRIEISADGQPSATTTWRSSSYGHSPQSTSSCLSLRSRRMCRIGHLYWSGG